MYQKVLDFWFKETNPSQWWGKDEEFDQLIVERFSDLHSKAIKCELFNWREFSQGRLAEIIILDQFSRNMFRGSALSFAHDSMALTLAQEAIKLGVNKELELVERKFIYMPFMHSESLKIHEMAVELFSEKGLEDNLDFEFRHKKVIERFGRYPHRNRILGRKSTAEEIEFLKLPGSTF